MSAKYPFKLTHKLNIPIKEDYIAQNMPKTTTLNYGTVVELFNGTEKYRNLITDIDDFTIKSKKNGVSLEMSLDMTVRSLNIEILKLAEMINNNRTDEFKYIIIELFETSIYKIFSSILFKIDELNTQEQITLTDFSKYILYRYQNLEFIHLTDKNYEINTDIESDIDFTITLQNAFQRAKKNNSKITIFDFLGNFKKYLNEDEYKHLSDK
jgi:hypothetical protein